ncbi:MAG: zinc ribbon domain-containing protein, partial [Ruminococcus sp.]|nr:zinc ribbon domain-containing protein [Ruminococcus sp.]
MFCSSCGKMIDDDSIFCRVCGKRVKPLPENDSSSTGKISLEKSIDIPITENETPYINEDNLQPESSNDTTEEVSTETPEDNKPFFGSTEPIEHINPEPLSENSLSEKIPERHTRETLPDLVLRKKVQTQSEDLPDEDFPTDDSQEDYEDYNDNSDTQYIPYEEIQENPDNNYNPPPVYNPPPYNPPPYPEEQPYFNPPPPQPVPPPAPVENNRPKQVGTFRLFGAGTVTIFTMLLVLLLSLLFCVKLGFSGAVLEKSIKGLDNEKVLDAEYDGNHDVNDFLYEKTNFYNITFGTASENDFRNFLLNLDMKYFIAENVSIYADYLLNGGRKPTLTSENITEYMFNKSG